MNLFHYTKYFDEISSFDSCAFQMQNTVLSQNHIAVSHTAQHGFFIAHIQGKPAPYQAFNACLLMGRLRLQNKPLGKYVTWLLYVPRVRPPHPIFRVFTQNHIGAHAMRNFLLIPYSFIIGALFNKTKLKAQINLKYKLAKCAELGQNCHTTKLLAVKPSRHTLAIFTPKHSTGVKLLSSLSTNHVRAVYGGLIAQNTIALVVNMRSRLVTVVETCHPIHRGALLTKLLGIIMKNLITGILATLSLLSPIQSLALGVILGLPITYLVITLSAGGVL